MALASLISRGQRGMDAYEVTVEVHLAVGLPTFTIPGLPAAAVRESRDRVRAALETFGSPVPVSRITALPISRKTAVVSICRSRSA